jgi:hypothetical protein
MALDDDYEQLLHSQAASNSLTPENKARLEENLALIRENRMRNQEQQHAAAAAAAAARAAAARAGARGGGLQLSQAAVGVAAAAAGGDLARRRKELIDKQRRLRTAVDQRRPDAVALMDKARRELEEEQAAAAAAAAEAAAAAARAEEETEEEEEEEESVAETAGEAAPFGGRQLVGEFRGLGGRVICCLAFLDAWVTGGIPTCPLPTLSRPHPSASTPNRAVPPMEWRCTSEQLERYQSATANGNPSEVRAQPICTLN